MKFKKVAVGGTFDSLHKGHRALIEKAFEVGEHVIIGLTSDEMLQKEAELFSKRKRALQNFLKLNYEIVKLNDAYGPAISDSKIDAIVVSEETEARAAEINEIRKKRGLPALEIIVIPFVLAEDGKPISTTRIRAGEIDEEGRVLK
ncbi:MAG: phosphopantetheine adenylyltransferase [Methanobacteriota archaeon]